ncbi:hypothetical protein [Agrobacterium sp. NPDC089420]|uniref:hypothetical protein n=1 Tax=Agrobacterium sp. NPDC089420 TaxID=3363918 RepID=UPI0038510FA8
MPEDLEFQTSVEIEAAGLAAKRRAIVGAIANRQPRIARARMHAYLDNGRHRYRNWNLEHNVTVTYE